MNRVGAGDARFPCADRFNSAATAAAVFVRFNVAVGVTTAAAESTVAAATIATTAIPQAVVVDLDNAVVPPVIFPTTAAVRVSITPGDLELVDERASNHAEIPTHLGAHTMNYAQQ